MQNNQNDPRLVLLLDTLDYYRGIVLDSVEQECGDLPVWVRLRSRLLKAFGDRGLASRIRSIMEHEAPRDKERGVS